MINELVKFEKVDKNDVAISYIEVDTHTADDLPKLKKEKRDLKIDELMEDTDNTKQIEKLDSIIGNINPGNEWGTSGPNIGSTGYVGAPMGVVSPVVKTDVVKLDDYIETSSTSPTEDIAKIWGKVTDKLYEKMEDLASLNTPPFDNKIDFSCGDDMGTILNRLRGKITGSTTWVMTESRMGGSCFILIPPNIYDMMINNKINFGMNHKMKKSDRLSDKIIIGRTNEHITSAPLVLFFKEFDQYQVTNPTSLNIFMNTRFEYKIEEIGNNAYKSFTEINIQF